jgi:hypothetical protein
MNQDKPAREKARAASRSMVASGVVFPKTEVLEKPLWVDFLCLNF